MASPYPKPQPGSAHGTATPASVGTPGGRTPYIQNCAVLLDWWLVRAEGQAGKIRVAGYTTKKGAARLFTSGSITTRHADGALDTADEKIVLIRGPLNIPQMHQNGFTDEVCKWFKLGFPVHWEKIVNSNMEQNNKHAHTPSKSTEYYIEKFLNGNFMKSLEYNCSWKDFNTFKGSTDNIDGPPIQNHSILFNGAPSPEETLTDPRDTFNHGKVQHDVVHTDASEVTHSVDSVLVGSHTDKTFSDLAEFQTPKLDVPTKGMTPQFEAVQCSEDNTIRRLRNGKVFGMSNSVSLKKGYSKMKPMQLKTFSKKMVSNEDLTPTVDLTYQGASVAPIIASGKLQSPDSRCGGKARKRTRSTVQ